MSALLVSHRSSSVISKDLPQCGSAVSCFAPEADLCRFYSRHATGVESLAFTDDAQWLAVGRTDGQIDLYDSARRQLIMSLPGSENTSVRCLRFVPKLIPDDIKHVSLFRYRLFSAGLHGVITEWDLRTQSPRYTSPSFGGAIFAMDIHEPLGLLVTANDDGGARLFKLRSDAGDLAKIHSDKEDVEEVLTFWKGVTKHEGRLLSVCFYGANRIYAGTANSQIIGWTLSQGLASVKMTVDRPTTSQPTASSTHKSHDVMQKAETLVWCVVPLPQHQLLASGDSTGSVYLWNVETHTAFAMFRPHQLDVLGLVVCPVTGHSLFSVGLDGKLSIIVAVASDKVQSEWILSGSRHPHASDARALAISKRGEVATGSSDTVVAVMTDVLSCATRKQILPSLSGPISASWIHVSESMRLVLGIQPNYLDLWCLLETPEGNSPKPVKTVRLELDDKGQGWQAIRCAALSPDGTLIAVSNDTGTRLFRFDLEELTLTAVGFKKLRQRISTALHFVYCGAQRCLLTATIGRRGEQKRRAKLTVWDLDTETVAAEFTSLSCAIASITVSPDGQWCATRSCVGEVVVYSLDKMERVHELPQFLTVDGSDGSRSNKAERSTAPASRMAAATAFSPDSQYLVVFSYCPKYFMIYAMSLRRCLTGNDVAPRQALLTSEPGIFRVPQLSVTSEDEIGRVLWVSRLETRLTNHNEAQNVKMQVLLVQTRQCLLSLKFQILDSTETVPLEHTMDDVNVSTPAKLHSSEKRRRLSSVDDTTKSLPCRSRKAKSTLTKIYRPSNGVEFLYATILPLLETSSPNGNHNGSPTAMSDVAAASYSLLMFAQTKNIPFDQLPPVVAKKRYAT